MVSSFCYKSLHPCLFSWCPVLLDVFEEFLLENSNLQTLLISMDEIMDVLLWPSHDHIVSHCFGEGYGFQKYCVIVWRYT